MIAIAPNLLAISAVLGVIGWLNIPLDMMTTTIAAVCIGIGVDDTIHYLHRFREEYPSLMDRVDFGSHQRIPRSEASPDQLVLFDFDGKPK